MNKIETFQQFLTTHSAEISLWGFIFNLILATFLSFILSKVYIRYGSTLSNRRMFAWNFIMITMTTMLIITVVKSSLALSLGLVGALSIVRFRAAIKDPEELSYLFLAIALGLGFGADQRVITTIAFLIIITVIIFRKKALKSVEEQNLFLTINVTKNPNNVQLDEIIKTLKTTCNGINLRRFDETSEQLEATFQVMLENYEELDRCKRELQKLSPEISITFLDHKGMI